MTPATVEDSTKSPLFRHATTPAMDLSGQSVNRAFVRGGNRIESTILRDPHHQFSLQNPSSDFNRIPNLRSQWELVEAC